MPPAPLASPVGVTDRKPLRHARHNSLHALHVAQAELANRTVDDHVVKKRLGRRAPENVKQPVNILARPGLHRRTCGGEFISLRLRFRGSVLETRDHALFKLANTHLLEHAPREKRRLGAEADIIRPGRRGRLL